MVLPVRIDPVPAAIITIVINSGAYIAEITRVRFCRSIKDLKKPAWRWGYRRAAPCGMSLCRWLSADDPGIRQSMDYQY
jgi:hypothetical protein